MNTRAFVTAIALTLAAGGSVPAAEAPPAGVAARVGDEDISLQEVETPLRQKLARLEQQRYELLQQRLEQLVGDRLIAREARQRGVSVEQLLKEEVYTQTPPVSDDEVSSFMEDNRSRLGDGTEAELRLKVWDYLRSQRIAQRRQAYVATLRAKTPVAVYLAEPEPTRMPVRADTGPSRGPADAPVVIVEFSDFQCPYCRTVVATVKDVLDRYPGKVRWVFRDFPLVQLHPGAPKVHEAARCAGAQGRFWEYHDLLFEQSTQHAPAQLRKHAEDLKLDVAAFSECLDSGRFAGAVQKDLEEGLSLGITGTPTFFVNGRPLVGAQPYAAFARTIESELQRNAAR